MSAHGSFSHETIGGDGRLRARPGEFATSGPAGAGLHPLGLGQGRDGLLYWPSGLEPDRPLPLILMLHGAGGTARDVLSLLKGNADQHGFAVLAPDSRASDTWDLIRGNYGPDLQFLDQSLAFVFERLLIDPERIAIGGFSDGASYALSVGLTNGDLFRHVLAFSPGFASAPDAIGDPAIFISHGDRDEILPVDICGRRLARDLPRAGYEVEYHEFKGGHVVPKDIVDLAISRVLA